MPCFYTTGDKKINMQIDVLNIKGKKTGRTIELPDEIFGAEPNDHVIYLAVKQYLGAQRQGTHKVKTRAEVHGASRKLHRQKGTGGSRKGNIRNPLYKGGGTVFGPKPHGYDIKLNRKVKDLAKISALSHKAKDNSIFVVEDINLEAPKTKTFVDMLGGLKADGKKVLFVIPEYNDNVYLSFRNVPVVNGILLSDMNTYDIVNADVVVLTEGAAKIFSEEEVEA
jgi:large subunit ribosomal protein L4